MNNEFSFKDVQPDMSDIPSYATLDEAVLYVAEANNALFNELKREIGLNELGIFETTGNTISYVVEAGEEGENKEGLVDKAKAAGGAAVNKGKALVDRIIKLIEAAAAKLKGLFEAGMRKISELAAKAATAFGKRLNAEKIKENLGDKVIKYKFGDYDRLEDFLRNGIESDPMNAFRNIKKSGAELTKDGLNKYFEGTVEERTLDANGIDQMVKVINDFKSRNDAIKKAYKSCQDHLNAIKKDVKSAKEINAEKLAGIQQAIAENTLVFGTAISAYYKLMRNNVNVLVKAFNKGTKVAKAADKAKEFADTHTPRDVVDSVKEKVKSKAPKGVPVTVKSNESAVEEVVEESATKTYTEEVESLFNWSF